MKCPRCQRENPADVKFCGECGARLEAVCPACAAANPRANKFRHQCVLRAFAEELTGIGAARAIRDGGDEFMVVGAPERTNLAADLHDFRAKWPASFRAKFGSDALPVAPRILVSRARCGALRKAREELGREVGGLKLKSAQPGPEGILEEREAMIA